MAANSEFANILYKLLHEELAKNKNNNDNIIAKSMLSHLDNVGAALKSHKFLIEEHSLETRIKNLKKFDSMIDTGQENEGE